MAYDTFLEERMTQYMIEQKYPHESKKMMGGLVYMVDGKMCFGIVGNQMMARIHPNFYEEACQMEHVSEMNFTGRSMKGYVFVQPDGIDLAEDLGFWIEQCMAFNPLAKASKKRKK